MPAPIASLGLVGDGDEADVFRDLERAFGVVFGDHVARWKTVGDIERDLLALYPAAATPGLCGSAMAFRRLRATLPATSARARPGTSLASLTPGAASRRLDASLRDAGLYANVSRGGVVATLGVLTGFAGLLLLVPLLLLGHMWPALGLLAAGVVMVSLDRGVPRDATLGEMARDTAAMNFARFAERGADRRDVAIRDAVRRIIAQTACVEPGAIGRETRLFD